MNIQYQTMVGFGPTAWNHGGSTVSIPSMRHHRGQANGKKETNGHKTSVPHPKEDHLVRVYLAGYTDSL